MYKEIVRKNIIFLNDSRASLISPHFSLSLSLSVWHTHINKNNSRRIQSDYFEINKFSWQSQPRNEDQSILLYPNALAKQISVIETH